MDWQAWAAQWRRLVSELQAAEGAAADALPAAPADAARSEAQARRTATQLRQQVAKHLAAVETLCAAAAADPSPRASPQLARRAQRCEAAAAQLRAAQQHQLREARQEEEQLGAEYEASMQRVQQLLQGAPYAPARAQHEAGHGSAGGASSRRQSVTVAAAASAAATEGGLPPEVAACDAFLQRHGPTGGWHPDDHAEFERILAACRGNYAHCVQLAAQELGLLHSGEELARHARWHEELQRLQLAKRLAVQRWRLQRQAERAAALERQAAEAAAAREAQEAAGAAARLQQEQQEREQQRVALAEWKRSRLVAAEEDQRQREAEEREQRRREAAARQQRQQENRQALEQWQLQKQEAEAQQPPCSESSRGSAGALLDPAARQRLQERNAQLLQRRAVAVAARGAAAAAQAERAEALQRRASQQFVGAAERDPIRLLAPTSAAAMRQLAALSEERSPRDSGYIRHLPRRAVPSWCSGARPC